MSAVPPSATYSSRQGGAYTRTRVIVDRDTGLPRDLTGFTATFHLYPLANGQIAKPAALLRDTTNTKVAIDTGTSALTDALTPDDSLALAATDYWAELFLTSAGGNREFYEGGRWSHAESGLGTATVVSPPPPTSGAGFVAVTVAAGTVNNWDPGSAKYLLVDTTAGAASLTGVLPTASPTGELTVVNAGPNDITLAHQDAGSAAANRLLCVGGSDLVLGPDDAAVLLYDAVSGRHRAYAA